MDVENHMVLGDGPYENECEVNYTIHDLMDSVEMTTEDVKSLAGHKDIYIDKYTISFDFHYDDNEEGFRVNGLKCTEDDVDAFSEERVKELKENVEEKLDVLYTRVAEKNRLKRA
jgi:hypothetical protein